LTYSLPLISMETVYKAQSGKLSFSRNIPHGCVFCHALKGPGEAFLVCSGCKAVRYCNREHQVAHWRLHKSFCKDHRLIHQSLKSGDAGDLQAHQERQHLLEDFIDLHRYSLLQSMASAIHAANSSFDFQKQMALFFLSYRPESGGNPSTAFKMTSARFVDNPPPDTPMGTNFAAFRPLLDESDREDREKPGYQGLLVCAYVTDDQFIGRLTALAIFESDLCRQISKHDEWFAKLKFRLDRGLVFRLREEETRTSWKPGMMRREGAKWVWREKSIEEFRQYGIYLSKA